MLDKDITKSSNSLSPNYNKKNHNRIDGWTTYNSSTFVVDGERFKAVEVAFQNTAGLEKHQAVAMKNSADYCTFYRCSFERNAATIFQSCNIYVRKPLPEQKNTITAQVLLDGWNGMKRLDLTLCIMRSLETMDKYSRTVFMQSYIDELISPPWWLEWNETFGLDTLYYGEFENYGPGANTSMRVKWPGYSLWNATQAMGFTVYNFTMGDTWLHETDVPFSGGLCH
ncbi:Plant invertase/pectin methylesterase inhibitor superfamily, putative [Theobroma cacao]|uniref:Plant invertase/pectin methylesterase inhibitor superfamily, putative n=1 Tax=Theobroma cacao TaxID=3641 RepID=A0A061FQ84_THECC|nr:Plant invertase/pectin methylesterase inhibitor superfamily, putative [Theobroma cacao]